MSEAPLDGCTVLLTRPRGQGEGLRDRLLARGAHCFELPMLRIEPDGDADAQRDRLLAQPAHDGWIFTSSNAVRAVQQLGIREFAPCYAIGEATATALQEAGAPAVVFPRGGSNSESLLALEELQAIRGKRFLLCAGVGGRDLIERELRARGAEVERLSLYRRLPEAHSSDEVEAALQETDAVIVTSGEGLQQLLDLATPAQAQALRTGLLVVPSPRVLELARRQGFARVHAPTHTNDAALADCLERAWTHANDAEKTMSDDAAKSDAKKEESNPATAAPTPDSTLTPQASQPPPPPPPPPRPVAEARSRGGSGGTIVAVAMGVIILALLGVVGYAGWLLIQERTQLLARIEAQNEKIAGFDARIIANEGRVESVKDQQQELARKAEAGGAAFESLEKQVGEGLAQISRVSAEIAGGRARFELASVEHLLTLANDRLLISHDVKAALTALESADTRLAKLADPQLFAVRAALSDEIASLRAIEVADTSAAALSLASLIQKVPDLPLRNQAPEEFTSPEARDLPDSTLEAGWQRFLESARTAAKSLFTVRREDDAGVLRLLSPQAETAVYDILTLKLEGARVALIQGDGEAMREQLRSASGWLSRQFRAEDRAVKSMREELERIAGLSLTPELPDISKSLSTLRRKLQSTES